VGRDWSKLKRREQGQHAQREAMADVLTFPIPTDDERLTKDQMRAETDALMASYGGRINQLPTYLSLKCYSCNHRGRVRLTPGRKTRFRCSKCGAVSM
jgi:hypothetical protein